MGHDKSRQYHDSEYPKVPDMIAEITKYVEECLIPCYRESKQTPPKFPTKPELIALAEALRRILDCDEFYWLARVTLERAKKVNNDENRALAEELVFMLSGIKSYVPDWFKYMGSQLDPGEYSAIEETLAMKRKLHNTETEVVRIKEGEHPHIIKWLEDVKELNKIHCICNNFSFLSFFY
jgi:hypothetical protein